MLGVGDGAVGVLVRVTDGVAVSVGVVVMMAVGVDEGVVVAIGVDVDTVLTGVGVSANASRAVRNDKSNDAAITMTKTIGT